MAKHLFAKVFRLPVRSKVHVVLTSVLMSVPVFVAVFVHVITADELAGRKCSISGTSIVAFVVTWSVE